MSFTNPLALILLLAVPFVIYIGWPRHVYRRRRDTTSLILRIIIVTCLALGLSGTQVSRAADKLAVIFLVDVSDSIGTEVREQQLEYVQQSIENMGPDDVYGMVVFGANSITEHPVSALRDLAPIQSAPITSNTDIAEAVRLGLALFPDDAARRMVILSDGRPTVGDTEAAVRLAAAAGVEISYAAFARQAGPEVQVTELNVPTGVPAGQEFDLNLTIEAEEATAATVTILASGQVIHREDVTLRQGTNNYTLTLPGTTAGFKDFRAQIDTTGEADSFYQNNQLSAFSQIIGPPRVLLVATDDAEVQYLMPSLREIGVEIDQVQPNDLPIGLAPLAQYDSVILANVPATLLSAQRMEALNSYVRDLGGGLIVIGGPDSYGPGGYWRTPLEETLPVEMQIRDQQRLPQLTIAYVIDRSGSMGIPGPSGVENIELAKEAIIRSIDFLQPTDRAGVVSFDAVAYWIADIQPVFDRVALQRLVATLRASGGTDILAGMMLVARQIVDDPSDRKHIILLTDGGANPRNLVELTGQLNAEAGVTTSVISIGENVDFLAEMARVGGGNYHVVDTVESIPTIFTLETVLATRSYILEQPFTPSLSAISPIMEGINSAPELLGYVAATPKQTAQVILRGPEPYNDPILTSWQYGLGRAVAFTSDATSRWGANWITWSNFTRFWSQAIRWTITEGKSNNLEMRVVMEGEQARLVVDARDDAGQFLNGLDLQAAVVNPALDPLSIDLHQVAPGRYEALFIPDQEGAYFLGVNGAGVVNEQPLQLSQTSGWVMSYSPEYDIQERGADIDLLSDIAVLTNGTDMRDDPALPFRHNLVVQSANTPIWPWLMLVALLLLPFDIAVRRLIITMSDLRRARQAVFGRMPAMAEGPSERFSALLNAKERGRQRAEEPANTPTPANTASALRANRDRARAERDVQPPTSAPTTSGDQPRYQPPRAPQQPTRSEGGNVAGELLKRRKGQQGDDQD